MYSVEYGIHFQSTYIVISTAHTDLGLRCITFSLNINKLPIFSEITQAYHNIVIKIVYIYGQMSLHTEF